MKNEADQYQDDSLTRMTGHDFLNIFSTIMANVELLRDDTALNDTACRRLERIMEASRRGETLVRSIRGGAAEVSKSKGKERVGSLTGKVLIVDDEEDMGEILTRCLSSRGLRVKVETSSLRAMDFFHANADAIDLVITDYNMPEKSGMEFCSGVKQIRPDLPQIMITGYDFDFSDEVMTAAGISMVLRKPFEREVILDAVERLLP